MLQKPNLLAQVQHAFSTRHYSSKTEIAYTDWIYRYLLFCGNKDPDKMEQTEISEFLSFLAVERHVSLSTQNQAFNALLFLYNEVLNKPLNSISYEFSKIGKTTPVILSREEIKNTLNNMNGESWLMASLLYGCGLKLNECLNLRVKDVSFKQNTIGIFSYDVGTERKTLFPENLKKQVQSYIDRAKTKLKSNLLIEKFGGATLPVQVTRRYADVGFNSGWQYLFPASILTNDKTTGELKQHHRDASYLQKTVKSVFLKLGISKNASCNSFRHSFAKHLLEDGYDIHLVQKLLGHKDVRTTMKYKRLIQRNIFNIRSPLDRIGFT